MVTLSMMHEHRRERKRERGWHRWTRGRTAPAGEVLAVPGSNGLYSDTLVDDGGDGEHGGEESKHGSERGQTMVVACG